MKEVVSKFIRTFGCDTGYSGSVRVIYIKGERAHEALRAVRDKWPNLAFYVRVAEEIPAEAERATTPFQEKLLPIVKDLVNTLSPGEKKEFKDTMTAQAQEFEAKILEQVAAGTPATLEQVDAYILSHPIDRKAKGPYNDAVKALGVKVEYVRNRHCKLRAKNLIVETEYTNA